MESCHIIRCDKLLKYILDYLNLLCSQIENKYRERVKMYTSAHYLQSNINLEVLRSKSTGLGWPSVAKLKLEILST